MHNCMIGINLLLYLFISIRGKLIQSIGILTYQFIRCAIKIQEQTTATFNKPFNQNTIQIPAYLNASILTCLLVYIGTEIQEYQTDSC